MVTTPPLGIDEYQHKAIRTDRTRNAGAKLDVTVLGLIGEAGSLLSEAKKKQRDSRSYLGYEDTVIEEMGDMLWYLAAVAHHNRLKLSDIAAPLRRVSRSHLMFAELQPQQDLPLASPSVAFEQTLLQLAASVGRLADFTANGSPEDQEGLQSLLSSIFDTMVRAANESGITLEQAAVKSLQKANDRWPVDRVPPPPFDANFPEEEQLPRTLEVEIFERSSAGKTYVVQKCNGLFIGDRLTDNIMRPDDYRFHDAFHYAYAAILGWSPVIRALLRLKRKSQIRVDEGEDGARAILIEEGVATYVFGHAKNLNFFEGQGPGDLGFTFLKSVKQFVRGYEADTCPLWLWEEAILAGNDAFRYLQEHRRGRLNLDLNARSLKVGPLRR